MFVRCGNYDWLSYINELESKKAHEKLTQRVTVVFYTGPDKWNAEKRLREMINKVPELEKYFNDWNYIIIDVKEIDTSKIIDEQTRYFIKAIQAMYKGSYEGLRELKNMTKENFLYAAVITGSIDQVKNVLEGDEMDMCEGMERMAEEFRREGIIEGEARGKLKEKQNTLKEQLEIKFRNISNNLTNQLSKTSIEKFNVLTCHIFNVANEEDVLKIIN